ncbi:MAG: NAD-dependent histone deacetylase sir2 [Pycnora praestabilis]|nr:MAG: NAD-dependent histone deacetylase sir2 [Pycnora praestabilis]
METESPLIDASLRVSAVEVIDLTSDEESAPGNDALRRETSGNVHRDGIIDGEEEKHGEEAWESESLYEDALEGIGDEQLFAGEPNACTLDEALAFRKRLRNVGEDRFVLETVEAGKVTAKKLCTAFGIRPPTFLEGAPDEAYYPLLGLGISRELTKRIKLPQYNTIEDVVNLIRKSKNIIVLTGAGISTSLGIPDFRSKDTGLYSKLEHLGLSDPQEVFDIEIFKEDPRIDDVFSIFYSIAKDILPSSKKFSPTHAFIHLLQQRGKLLTNFTQNIDNLEGHAGILPEKLIQCHGSFATASCVVCKYQVQGEEIYEDLKASKVARCARCVREMMDARKKGLKRKRSSDRNQKVKRRRYDDEDSDDEGDYDLPEAGVMKPDITFFGEDLPSTFHDRLVKHDRDLVDLVIVIGTSLKVAPVSEIVGFLPPEVPQIYISRTPVSHVNFDVDMLGDCDVVVAELCKRAGWDLQHEMVPEGQEVDIQPSNGHDSRFTFTARMP